MAFFNILASLLLIGLTKGQVVQMEWSPDELKNPIDFPLECGFFENNPAYICDPNNILGKDIHSINWMLKDAAFNSTKCACSTYHCEHASKPTGYRIGIALIKKMKDIKSTDGTILSPSDKAQIFAYSLENTKWNMGNCEEDIVVFYSVADKTLAIYSGTTASEKLTPEFKNLIAYKAGTRLDEGRILEAINHIIHDIKMVLNCDSLDYDCDLYDFNPNHSSITVASVSFIAIATLSAIWSKHF